MRPVIIESPYAPNSTHTLEENLAYLHECLRHSISLGEAPFASHGFYPWLLDDTNLDERQKGIDMGYLWWPAAKCIVFYTDYGWSNGMRMARVRAERLALPIARRAIL